MALSHISRRNRIMTGIAGGVLSAGAVLGGFAAPAAASPASFDPGSLPSCADFVDPDGSPKSESADCLPVDPFTDPGLTLAQRIAFINDESPIHDQLVQELEDQFAE